MEIIGTVTRKGQITIPRSIREAIGLHPGDRVSFQIDPERNVLLRENMTNPSCAGLLWEYGKGITLTEDNIRDAIRQAI